MSGSEHTVIENVQHTDLVLPQVLLSTPTVTLSVDTTVARAACIAVQVGAPGTALSGSNKLTMSLEHGDTSVFSAVAAADVTWFRRSTYATLTGASVIVDANGEASDTYFAEYKGDKRYVKPVLEMTTTSIFTSGLPVASYGNQTGLHQYSTAFIDVGNNG